MVKTIGNPLSWTGQWLAGAATHVGESVEAIGGENVELRVQTLTNDDLREALRKGIDDFGAARADVIFIVLFYPIIGLILAGFGLQMNLLPLLFPVAAGFAIIGPFAAVGLYEISRRRENGEPVSWGAALSVLGRPGFSAIVVLGLGLLALFLVWLAVAHLIFLATLGPESPTSIGSFLSDVFTTGAGWAMIVIGTAVGFCFALFTLAISVVSFPLLLHRAVGVPRAVVASVEVFRKNPRVILTWGAIVAAGLVIGSIPLFIGLIIILPILGHATWHLYRKALVPA